MNMSASSSELRSLGACRPAAWRVSADHADLVRPVCSAMPVNVIAQPKPITIDLSRTAMIVVDMQNDFCHPDGWLASIGVPAITVELSSHESVDWDKNLAGVKALLMLPH